LTGKKEEKSRSVLWAFSGGMEGKCHRSGEYKKGGPQATKKIQSEARVFQFFCRLGGNNWQSEENDYFDLGGEGRGVKGSLCLKS